MAIIRRAAIGLALAACASAAHPQGIFGLIQCGPCPETAALPTPSLMGFKMPNRSRQPDVLWDERPAGGSDRFGDVPTTRDQQWSISPNWRIPQVSADLHVAIVTHPGLLMFSAGTINDQYFGVVPLQATCSYPGALGPLVRRSVTGHAVEWKPVLEEDATLVTGGCMRGAYTGRGAIVGYDVYRLPIASYPSPTLRDFVVHGWNGFADVTKVDFDVADPDGRSGSDRDPTDGLTLANPDGLPDTGDELLAFGDDDGPEEAWYRVQPVVRGDPTGVNRSTYPSSVQRNVNGDAILDTIDVDGDGFVEFIDPSGRGLGVTHGGEIATSLRAGRGRPAGERFDCSGNAVASVETQCGNGIDDDGDGRVDSADVDCALAPGGGVAEDCSNSVDDDFDDAVDCDDSDCAGDPACLVEECSNGTDDDADGAVDCDDADCATDPSCVVEDCGNGLDDDSDGDVDCDDLDCAGAPGCGGSENCANGTDDDSDGDVDCADADCCGSAPCNALPPAVDRIDVTKSAAGDSIVTWTASPAATSWDVLSGCIAHRASTGLAGCLWGDRSIASATCFAGRVVAPTVADARPIDADAHGFYYLVRERTACGVAGSYGTDSFGAEHVPGPGDCPP